MSLGLPSRRVTLSILLPTPKTVFAEFRGPSAPPCQMCTPKSSDQSLEHVASLLSSTTLQVMNFPQEFHGSLERRHRDNLALCIWQDMF